MSNETALDPVLIASVCDAILPSLPLPSHLEDEAVLNPAIQEFFSASASNSGISANVAAAIPQLAAPERRGVEALLAALADTDFMQLSDEDRWNRIFTLADGEPSLRLAVRQLRSMVLGAFAAGVDGTGTNPTWPALGYPGPATPPPTSSQAPKDIPVMNHSSVPQVLHADVVIVGSGGGGSVIAARAAQAGLDVLVLEAGPYRNEADMKQVDALGLEMWLRRGSLWSDSGQMGVFAGSVLGGGTLINSLVCLRLPHEMRSAWAAEGLEGIDGPDFDKYLDSVWSRLNVNTDATVYNNNTRAMITGLASRGYQHERIPRNVAYSDNPKLCGYCNAGCQQGSKRSTLHTYLQDARDAGARFLVDCRVDQILTEGGAVIGVAATLLGEGGERSVTVHAEQVVVAGGGIESPALLLRSGIGGPAVGKNLRLHPAWIVTGVYDEPVEAWHGQIQSAVSFDLAHAVDGVGFLVETLALAPGSWASNSAFDSPAAHRENLLKLRYFATWHGVSHDHGSGEVYLDEDDRAAVHWSLDDDVDYRVALLAHTELAQMHHDAGANEIFTFQWKDIRWRRGEDFDAFLALLESVPREDLTAFSAHQMGSCRMGASPEGSVADGWGQLHDIRGVWIGDASALPTAPGVNPMITLMALAERTADALIDAATAANQADKPSTASSGLNQVGGAP